MFDANDPRDRVITAALRLAEAEAWPAISLAAIANEASVPLTEVRKHFACKSAILSAFVRRVDDEVLRRTGNVLAEDETARDRIFDVVMTRFEVLQPYKAGLRNILEPAEGPRLVLLPVRPFVQSLYWMLAAAGIPTEGAGGALRMTGLGAAYSETFRVWLDDDDPGMARTMARLDRRLRRGERWLRNIDDMCGIVGGIGSRLAGARRRRRGRARREEAGGEAVDSYGREDAEGAQPAGGATTPPPGGDGNGNGNAPQQGSGI